MNRWFICAIRVSKRLISRYCMAAAILNYAISYVINNHCINHISVCFKKYVVIQSAHDRVLGGNSALKPQN